MVRKAEGGLHLCQSNYMKDLLKKANMVGAKGCPTPMVSGYELSKNIGEPVEDPKLLKIPSCIGVLLEPYNMQLLPDQISILQLTK